VALRWLSQRPGVIAPIFGTRTVQQLKDNLGAVDLTLDAEAIAALDSVSKPVSGGYPYGAFGSWQRSRWLGDGSAAPAPVFAGDLSIRSGRPSIPKYMLSVPTQAPKLRGAMRMHKPS
jgi:hypothetical protein